MNGEFGGGDVFMEAGTTVPRGKIKLMIIAESITVAHGGKAGA